MIMDPEVDKKTLALLTASSTVQKHNCLFLIQDTSHSTLYQPPKSHLFINAIQPLCQTGTGLVIMQSQKETTPILKLLEDANIRACEIKGHSEIVEVRSAVKESQEKAIPVIVTSSNCAMYMFCLGLVRMESLSFIFFDNLTGANKNHPYCMIMEGHYAPLLARRFMEGNFADPMPKIVGLAEWPIIVPGESLQAKLTRGQKLAQYHRLFHCTIVPICDIEDGRQDWMTMDEIEEARDISNVFGKIKAVFSDEPTLSILNILSNVEGKVLIIVKKDEEKIVQFLLENGKDASLVDEEGSTNKLLVVNEADKRLNQLFSMDLNKVILVDTNSDGMLNFLVLWGSRSTEIYSIRTMMDSSINTLATDMAYWTSLLIASAPVPSEISRQLHSLLGTMDVIARGSPYVPDQSQLHYRSPTTGALMLPCTNIFHLLAVCSHIPHSTGRLSLRTIPVQRVDDDGKSLDKSHYYMTSVTLPRCLSEAYIPEPEMSFTGPLAPSRFTAFTCAAFEALKKMHKYGVLDDNLIPIQELLDMGEVEGTLSLVAELNNDSTGFGDLQELDQVLDHLDQSSIMEIIPDPIKFDSSWKAIVQRQDQLLSTEDKIFDFYLHVFEYRTIQKYQMDKINWAETALPYETLLHMSDVNYFSSAESGRTFGIIFRRPLEGLRDIRIPISGNIVAQGSMSRPILLRLNKKEVDELIEFQAFLYGAINVRPLILSEEQGPIMMSSIPDEKKSAYLTAIVKVKDAPDLGSVAGIDDICDRYRNFVNGPRDARDVFKSNSTINDWILDWDLMKSVTDPSSYATLESITDQLSEIQTPQQVADLEAPEFLVSPDKPICQVDFFLFSLKRLILYSPHNGIFYRVKRWHSMLTPSSPFESKQLPECRTYADYMHLRYGIKVPDADKPGLVESKRIENFIDISRWIAKGEVAKGGHKRKGDCKSIVIPSLTRVAPIPYAFLRILTFLPKVIHDIERQLVAVQFYHDHLSPLRDVWPSEQLMIEALTGPSCGVQYDYERLEVLGDSVLKLFTTIDMFMGHRVTGEGQLSKLRQDRISNFNLYVQANRYSLSYYARIAPFVAKIFAPPEIGALLPIEGLEDKWPFIKVLFDDGIYKWTTIQELEAKSHRKFTLSHLYADGRIIDTEQKAQDPIRQRYKKKAELPAVCRFGYTVPAKCLADVMEALIASFYLGPSGLSGALEFLIHVGLCSEQVTSYAQLSDIDINRNLLSAEIDETLASKSVSIFTPQPSIKLEVFYAPSQADFPFDEIERILKYKFKSRRLLFLACTHSSIDITNCYERLEWLGDAALDWVVIKYYWDGFKDEAWMTPERITRSRQTAVCNEAFARIAVHHGLHNYLRLASPALHHEIKEFTNAYLSVKRGDEREIPPAPKALGDIFEAIAGALLLDCRFDMDLVGEKLLPLLQFFLDSHADPYDLPSNPLHDLWHDLRVSGASDKVDFVYEDASDGRTICKIIVRGKVIGEHPGLSRAFARTDAARKALEFIRSREWRDVCPV